LTDHILRKNAEASAHNLKTCENIILKLAHFDLFREKLAHLAHKIDLNENQKIYNQKSENQLPLT
jgi:hypothetical protein